ncbi:unnamed protein product [Dovyalis caffra]|uniref:Uncharacterized protein n=1 Tax=Dovyalis caffra TaxID=77055 RepID=A0AAV1SBX2_9ROSI|nr:unnamed protein product [Dovyalis caffra]
MAKRTNPFKPSVIIENRNIKLDGRTISAAIKLHFLEPLSQNQQNQGRKMSLIRQIVDGMLLDFFASLQPTAQLLIRKAQPNFTGCFAVAVMLLFLQHQQSLGSPPSQATTVDLENQAASSRA